MESARPTPRCRGTSHGLRRAPRILPAGCSGGCCALPRLSSSGASTVGSVRLPVWFLIARAKRGPSPKIA
eukprot:5135230-Lingulodinium_polyedra.AAC.1